MKYSASAVLALVAMPLVYGHEERYYEREEHVHVRDRPTHKDRYHERESAHVRGRASSNVISDEEIITTRAVPYDVARARANKPRNGDGFAAFCFDAYGFSPGTINKTNRGRSDNFDYDFVTADTITCTFRLKKGLTESADIEGIDPWAWDYEEGYEILTGGSCCEISIPDGGKKVKSVDVTTSGDDEVVLSGMYIDYFTEEKEDYAVFGEEAYCLSNDPTDEEIIEDQLGGELFAGGCYPGFKFKMNGKVKVITSGPIP
jgi:hypothetical protein